MPVNGPSGPASAGQTRRPDGTLNPDGSTKESVHEASNRATERSLPDLGRADESTRPGWGFDPTRQRIDRSPEGPLTSDAVMQDALDRFRTRTESILNLDAMSLARGRTPVGPDDNLSDAQRHDMVNATRDLLMDTPVSKLSPELAERVAVELRRHGIERDLSTTRLGDLGDVGGDLAKSFAERMRNESPAAFYGVGAAGAAALGYAAWSQGSDGLRRLGIKPEVRSSFFKSQVRVGVGADFDPHFANVRPTVSAELNFPGSRVGAPDFRLGSTATLSSSGGVERMTTTALVTSPTLSAAAQATTRGNQVELLAASLTYTPRPDFALSAGASYLNMPNTEPVTSVGVEAAWRLSEDADIAISATHSEPGESRIGFGGRIKF